MLVPVIAERIPQIATLSPQEKRTLMNELWEELEQTVGGGSDPEIVALLERRWQQYESDPASAVTLEEFRERLKRK
jgi:putative addiction module component (TIGR02574 family)